MASEHVRGTPRRCSAASCPSAASLSARTGSAAARCSSGRPTPARACSPVGSRLPTMGELIEFPGMDAVATLLEETAAKLRAGDLAMGHASQCVILLAGEHTD